MSNITRRRKTKVPTVVWLALPIYVVFLFVRVVPILGSLVISFTDMWHGRQFVGLANYREILGDEVARKALKNTLCFAAGAVPSNMLIAFAGALLIESIRRGKAFFRAVYFMPVITSMVGAAIVWTWLYQPMFGLINQLLRMIGLAPQMWLKSPKLALPSVIVMTVWKNFGYNLVLFMAALQGIPDVFYEAAKIDGAGIWKRLRHITIPLLRPATTFILITTLIGAFQVFTEVYVMTQDRGAGGSGSSAGGPGYATTVMVLLIHRIGFGDLRIGYASALAFVFFLLIMGVTFILLRLLRQNWSY